MARVYVGNLNPAVTDRDLEARAQRFLVYSNRRRHKARALPLVT